MSIDWVVWPFIHTLDEKAVKYLEFGRYLVRHGHLADDTTPGETFREVVEGLNALDEIRPAPPVSAPTSRLFCYHCRMWYDGLLSNKGEPCPDCMAEFEDSERRLIERNRNRGIPLCIICGAESPTSVCEQCEHRPMSQKTLLFDYRRLERRAAFGINDERAFCENCGAALPALFKDDGTPMGAEDCSVCEGLRQSWGGWPIGDYCRRCGIRKVRKECPLCG